MSRLTPSLLGRDDEIRQIDELLHGGRSSRSGALVVRGDAGIGKSALLDYAARSAASTQMTVIAVTGIESEGDLGFAALQRLLRPFLEQLDSLPGPQREALAAALGLRAEPANLFLVGLATLTVLTDAAAESPMLCVVDAAQWLDAESVEVLAFVARRLYADRLVVLFGVRDDGDHPSALDGLPIMRLGPLSATAAQELLTAVAPAPLHPQTTRQVIDDAKGYPLALLELSSDPLVGESIGRSPLPGSLTVPQRLESSIIRRVRTLPTPTQTWLLIVAAESSDDAVLLWRAAARLGLGFAVAEPAERDGLVTVGREITFRHPMIRTAIYRNATPTDRRRAHQALADALDRDEDADRRAWHLSASSIGPDETIAAALEQSAARSQRRGGWTAQAASLTRSAELTPDAARRSERYICAAEAALAGGMPEQAELLLDRASPLTEPFHRAVALRLRAAIMVLRQRFVDAPAALLAAARQLADYDYGRARETLLEAFEIALVAHEAVVGTSVDEIAEAADELHQRGTSSPSDQLVSGVSALLRGGYGEAAPMLRAALRALIDDGNRDVAMRWAKLGFLAAEVLWDETLFREWLSAVELHSREQGALPALRIALEGAANLALWEGRIADAQAAYDESTDIGAAIRPGDTPWLNMLMDIAAWRGDDATASSIQRTISRVADDLGVGSAIVAAERAMAILRIGRGQYLDALEWARRTYETDPPIHGNRALPDIVEVATRADDDRLAAQALVRLESLGAASATRWALGLLARSQALVAEEEAEPLYLRSLELLGATTVRTDLARAHLLYGEWLRRQRRRQHAREQLRIAHRIFTAMGAEAFAERSRVELLATGERASSSDNETRTELTPQEAQIARLAAEGGTNREIAGRLFISASTVDYHLRKVYPKLGISSRHQLAQALRT